MGLLLRIGIPLVGLFWIASARAADIAESGSGGTSASYRQQVDHCIHSPDVQKKTGSQNAAPFSFKKADASDPDVAAILNAPAQGNLDSLDSALSAQLRGCDGQPALDVQSGSIPSSKWCQQTNQQLKTLLDTYRQIHPKGDFAGYMKQVTKNFDFYKMDCPDNIPDQNVKQTGGVLFTAYDAPELKCRAHKEGKYKYPIYSSTPPSGKSLSNFSRKDLADTEYKGAKPQVIAYTDDPFELYALGIEGSGTCDMGQGKKMFVDFEGSNGKANPLMSQVLACMGISREDCKGSHPAADCHDRSRMNIPEMRAYFKKHPKDLDVALEFVPNVPFYQTPPRGPLGAEKIQMADDPSKMEKIQISNGHSLAAPPGMPLGAATLFQTWKPGPGETKVNENFSSLALTQDRGKAIKGCRIDWFAGADADASAASGTMHKEKGTLVIMVSK